MFTNPEKHCSQLLQCLSQGKGAIGFLLGAGCPFSIKDEKGKALIPDILGLTDEVLKKLQEDEHKVKYETFCNSLKKELGRQPNVEELLSRLRGLIDFAGSQKVDGMTKDELHSMEKTICALIKDQVAQQLPSSITPFHNLAAWMGAVDREKPVEIYTTNYDLLIEQALESSQLPYFDGFVGSYHPFFDPYAIDYEKLPIRWARLWKLHGSINWRAARDGARMIVWRGESGEGDLVIHPSHLKYEQSRKMPYLAMMDRLRQFISSPGSSLIIVGYSFNDQHLNDTIIQGLQGSPSSTGIALLYGNLKNYAEALSLANFRSNLTLLAKDGAVIGTKQFQWEERKEVLDSNIPKGAVEWQPAGEGIQGLKGAFNLGDFMQFGIFLQAISGNRG